MEPIFFVFLAVALLCLSPALLIILHSIAAVTLDAVRILRNRRR